MDDAAMDSLLAGDLRRLSALPKRVVRLFISSTFTDMTLERNMLMERVYPRLKRYCRERFGLDFQVVDMRWGVRDEATDDHQTVSMCSREIENCQRVSLGPNFVALIGDKYGFRPVSNRIKSSEFRALRRCLIEADTSTDTLDTWYKEDLNAVPAEYVLQPISSILKNFTNKREPDAQAIDQRIWQAIQGRLHELLLIGSQRLVQQGRMSAAEQALKYSISVTEREVIDGCLELANASRHCLVYVRSIVDLSDQLDRCLAGQRANKQEQQQQQQQQQQLAVLKNTSDQDEDDESSSDVVGNDSRRDSAARKASLKIGDDTIRLNTSGGQTSAERRAERARRLIGRYVDLVLVDESAGRWSVDEEAQAALGELKTSKLARHFATSSSGSKRNMSTYQVHWNESDGISLKSDEHKQYLDEFTEHFYTNLARMIRAAVRTERHRTASTGLLAEVLQHSHYALNAAKQVCGRSSELEQLRAYVLFGGDEIVSKQQQHCVLGTLPMFVYGASGSGKTCLLAKMVTLIGEWVMKQTRQRRRSSVLANAQKEDEQQQVTVNSTSDRWYRRPCLVMRFCCTTPASSSMVGMLTSVCRQLQYNFYQFGPLNGLDERVQINQREGASGDTQAPQLIDLARTQLPFAPLPDDFIRLVYTFRQLLENCAHQLHRRRLFVIVLDSLERLSSPADTSAASKFSWLTSITRLPPNVRLIVSCSSSASLNVHDFAHLKRHFLRAHFAERQAKFSSPSASSSSSSLASSTDGQELVSTGSSLSMPSQSIANQLTDRDEAREHSSSKYTILRRILLPAIRLARNSRANVFLADNVAAELTTPTAARSPTTTQVMFAPTIASRTTHNLMPAKANTARRRRRKCWQTGLLHVKPLGKALAVAVLRQRLADAGRTLSKQQWALVERSFECCSRPIFVKLALGEVIHWKSYSMQGDTRGLTFGSAWLAANHSELASSELSSSSPVVSRLERLVSARQDAASDSNKFKWHVLAMEQQWLNFIEYKARQRERQLANKQLDKSGGNLIIRIGNQTASPANRRSSGQQTAVSATTSDLQASSVSVCRLSNSIEDAICQLFARIELQHGYLLTKHSLSYISAAANGIGENELEDILSLDDIVLDDVFQYHLPPVRRIPPLLWTRLRADLPDYLSERDADGIVITWHHDQFKQVTQRRYLANAHQLEYVHSTLADYFLGKWADKAKPFRCTQQQIQLAAEQLESAVQQAKRDSQTGGVSSSSSNRPSLSGATSSRRLASGSARSGGGASFSVRQRLRSSDQHEQRLQWARAKAHRRVPHQPLYYSDTQSVSGELQAATERKDQSVESATRLASRKRKYNLRKLTELPFHLMRSGRFLELCHEVLFNYNWLFASIDALGMQNLFADVSRALDELSAQLHNAQQNEQNQQDDDDDQDDNSILAEHDFVRRDRLDRDTLETLVEQLQVLDKTLRLSSSVIHSDIQMLAPQLVGRLVQVVARMQRQQPLGEANVYTRQQAHNNTIQIATRNANSLLAQLLQQCDRDGSADCALLPVAACLQSVDGLQLSSLEGHQFGCTAMIVARDARHLMGVSNKFIMWNISTGQVARDIKPDESTSSSSIIRELVASSNDRMAFAYTSANVVLALDVLTQQVAKWAPNGDDETLLGLRLIDLRAGRRFFVWTRTRWLVFSLVNADTIGDQQQQREAASASQHIRLDYSMRVSDVVLSNGAAECELVELSIEQTATRVDLTLLTLHEGDDLLRLATVRVRDGALVDTWPTCVRARRALSVAKSLTQVVYVDCEGRVRLSRRRAKSWSKSKYLVESCAQQPPDSGDWPLALELDGGGGDLREYQNDSLSDEYEENADQLDELAEFERQIDNNNDDDDDERHTVFKKRATCRAQATGRRSSDADAIKFVRLHWPQQIDVIDLVARASHSLVLPRDVRNICVRPNAGQLLSELICCAPNDHLLVVAANRRLLVFSVQRRELLRCIDAHDGRITRLLLVPRTVAATTNQSNRQLCVASCSLDRRVKIWNLSNVNKRQESLGKLAAGSIESLAVAGQVVACLANGSLSLWDWRTLELLAKFESSNDNNNSTQRSPYVKCKFSSNGRLLALATCTSLELIAIESSAREQAANSRATAPSVRFSSSSTQALDLTNDSLQFKRLGSCRLPRFGRVTKLVFVSQDSRLISTTNCLSRGAKKSALPPEDSERTLSSSSSSSSSSRSTSSTHDVDNLSLVCHSIPDLRQLFAVECRVPASRRSDVRAQKMACVTTDQQFVVVISAAAEASASSPLVGQRRRSSAIVKPALSLNVYATRDGQLIKSIDLQRLQALEHLTPQHRQQTGESGASFVSLNGEQFVRIKAINQRERQSIVALIDEQRGSSYFIDVQTKLLVCQSNAWNGKLSSDGRFGLSHVSAPSLKSLAALPTTTTTTTSRTTNNNKLATASAISAGHLQLLEMRRCQPIKSLLNANQMSDLLAGNTNRSTSVASSQVSTSTKVRNNHLFNGFTQPNDAYVFHCDQRHRRLLLIRTRDSQPIANYKLDDELIALKCSSDGYALVLGYANGQLAALAIVDPQQSDTFARLAHFKSRKQIQSSG